MDTSTYFEKKEECGIIALYSKKGVDVAPYLHRALMALQHRGQDAAGFSVLSLEPRVLETKGKAQDSKLKTIKGLGLVSEVFKPADLLVKGSVGIGHTRYPTSGYIKEVDVQPFVYKNIAIAHNGHIANFEVIKKRLEAGGYKYMSSVDSETIAFLIDEKTDGNDSLDIAITALMKEIDGAYSNVAIVNGALTVFRDPHAIRPLVYGENEDFICFASETAALDINNIPHKGQVFGGELVTVENGKVKRRILNKKTPFNCMFEFVYFSRPDSTINDTSVFQVRRRLGEQLAKEHPAKADVIVPIPDTARTAAETYSQATKIPMQEGLIKNRYIGRTFIMPTQDKRSDAVKLKLNPVREVVNGKRVVLIDDSIVRGTTLREIVKLVRDAGAKEIHVRVTCPPIKAPCFYGVDMKTYNELIAYNKSVEEIRAFVGADSLGYISIEGLKKAIGLSVCTGCLNEDYKTPFAKKLAEEKRNEAMGCG